MLLPPPEHAAAVLDGAVVATSAKPLLVELLRTFRVEKPRLKEDAVADVAEGALFLVETGLGERACRNQEEGRERRDKGEEPDQGVWCRSFNRRLPA